MLSPIAQPEAVGWIFAQIAHLFSLFLKFGATASLG